MCLHPIAIKKKHPKASDLTGGQQEYYANVPCGKCPECKRATAAKWAFRLQEQLNDQNTQPFAGVITLTYDTKWDNKLKTQQRTWQEDKWITPQKEKLKEPGGILTNLGLLTLNYDHVQLWMKRVRKQVRKRLRETGRAHKDENDKWVYDKKVKYFCAGEYGSLTQRPHYHVIVYGATEDELTNCWNYGGSYYDTLSNKAIFYTCKYLDKDFHVDPRNPLDDRFPESRHMSQGIGECWLNNKSVYNKIKDGELWEVPMNNSKIGIPRYYVDKVHKPKRHRRSTIQDKRYLKLRNQNDAEKLEKIKKEPYIGHTEDREVMRINAKYTRFKKTQRIREPITKPK